MSADNTIAILQTLGPEFRVVHMQGLDNIYFWPTCCADPDIVEKMPDYTQNCDIDDLCYHIICENCGKIDPSFEHREKINPMVILDYFKDCKIFLTEKEAYQEADRLYTEIMNDDICPIVEYGIQKINGLEDCPFPTKDDR